MAKYIQICNTGEIDPQGFILLGASTKKEDDTKIGFFGSGLKYVVAYLLRNNLFFEVYSGNPRIEFSSKEINFRDQVFHKIIVNAQETSLCTHLGEHWTKWHIFREIMSNALDEDSYSIELVDEIIPVAGLTKFYICYEDFKEYYDNLEKYFNVDLLGSTTSKVIVKPEVSELNVFKKGVRVMPDRVKPIMSLFDYHLLDIDLNEERVASMWDVRYYVTQELLRLKDPDQVELLYNKLVERRSDLFEVEEVLSSLGEYSRLSATWLDVLNESDNKVLPEGTKDIIEERQGSGYIEDNKITFLPDKFKAAVSNSFGDKFKNDFDNKEVTATYMVVEKTNLQERLIGECLDIFQNNNIKFDYEVEVVMFKDPKVRSYCKDGCMYLASSSFDDELLTSVLPVVLEGYIKAKYEVVDYTEEMQSACLEVLTGLMLK